MEESLSAALSKVKVLDITLGDFKTRFGHIIKFDRQGADFLLEMKEQVTDTLDATSDDVKTVLKKCLKGNISNAELQEWANFLILCDVYEVASGEAKETQEATLAVLHRIANPEINSELTDAMVKYYLGCLETKQEPTL